MKKSSGLIETHRKHKIGSQKKREFFEDEKEKN